MLGVWGCNVRGLGLDLFGTLLGGSEVSALKAELEP